jgi:predicted nucleic acid-binding protein
VIAFLDASALIYRMEGVEALATSVTAELARIAKRHPGVRLAASRLTWLECRVKPMKDNNGALLAQYDAFFDRPDLIWVELTRDVVELAAAIRARHGLRTPDALQAASCLQLGQAHVMLTGDATFQRVAGLNVVLIQ